MKNHNGDLIFEFTYRVTAFDGKKKAEYDKGNINSLDKDVFSKDAEFKYYMGIQFY